jgi:phage host-nuclease inhibitor protein Gam
MSEGSVPVMPELAPGVAAVFLDPAASWAGTVGSDPVGARYQPVVATTVQLLYDDTTAGVSHQEAFEAVIHPLGGIIGPDTVHAVDHDPRDFLGAPPSTLEFVITDAPIGSKTFWTGLESDLKGYLVANQKTSVFKNTGLRLYSRVGETEEEFIARARESAEDAGDQALAKLKDSYATRIARVQDSISKAENRVADLQEDASSRQSDELLSGAGDLLGALLGGRKRSNPLGQAARRRAASQKAQSRADNATEALADEQRELVELEDELAVKITEISDQFEAKASQIETVEIPLEKTDIRVVELKLVWVPVR